MRLTLTLTALVAACAVAPSPAGAAPRCTPPRISSGATSVSAVPSFPLANRNTTHVPLVDNLSDTDEAALGIDGVRGLAADPLSPSRVYVFNSDTLLRSQDGGCTWAQVFHLPHLGADTATVATAETDRLASLTIGRTAIYLVTRPLRKSWTFRTGGVGRLRVLRSTDRGAHFTESDSGVLPVDGYGDVTVAPGDPKVAYLATETGSPAVKVLYRSGDTGATWTRQAAGVAPRPRDCCWVNPANANEVWAATNTDDATQLAYHSTDGGATFATVGVKGVPAGLFALRLTGVYYGPKNAVRLLVHGQNTADPHYVFGYADNGGSFTALPAPPAGVSWERFDYYDELWNTQTSLDAVFGNRKDEFVMVMDKEAPGGLCQHLFSYDAKRRGGWRQLTSFGESTSSGSQNTCTGGVLVAAPGARGVVRMLVVIDFGSSATADPPVGYVVTHTGRE
jgi:hypothetical protein